MSSTAALSEVTARPSRSLNVGLWAAQVLLAMAFAMAGYMKLAAPIDDLAQRAEWMGNAAGLVRFIGVAELAGALGVVFPALTRIQPHLTVVAAFGLTLVMVLAVGFHVLRGEFAMLALPLVLGSLAAFVAWGRSRKAPIRI